MRLDLIRSKPEFDRTAESSVFIGVSSYRGAKNDADCIHSHFAFDDYLGEMPHARVSIKWADIEAMVNAFAIKGHPGALRMQRADQLATKVEELAKHSN
jgi:hypothetical protein